MTPSGRAAGGTSAPAGAANRQVESTTSELEAGASPSPAFSRDALCLWMDGMEEYGQVFGEDFGPDFFSQEYWYLFVVALARYWRDAPLNVGEACATMKTGSLKTRETRLKRLIDEQWFRKQKRDADLRKTYVVPTGQLLRVGHGHLASSLLHVARRLCDGRLLAPRVELTLHRQLQCPADEPPPLLVGWAEFLIDYTNDWNATFRNRFHTEEYWYPFVHCLRGHWAGSPLTMTAACEVMRTGSHRTRETRVAIAEGRGMLQKRKSASDLRNTLILPTTALETALVGHFSRTLEQLMRLLGGACDSAAAALPSPIR